MKTLKYLIFYFILILLVIILIKKKKKYESFDNLHIEDNLSIAFKTIYRKKLIIEQIKKIRKLFPNITIIIGDDSDSNYVKETQKLINNNFPNDKNIKYLSFPFNSGLSYVRNKLINATTTKYLILTDDSRYLNSKIKSLKNIIQFLDVNENIKMICGSITNRKEHLYQTSFFKHISNDEGNILDEKKVRDNIKNNVNITLNYEIKQKKHNNNLNLKLFNTHLGFNNFIARTDTLKKYKWDENRGTTHSSGYTEHEDYFLRLWLDKIKILFSEDLIFTQFNDNIRKYDKNGNNLRNRPKNNKIYKISLNEL